ncbi:MAG: hypothetical protein LR015_14680 [Verrucomicrobia bacterium]|nr:hypothetical protein [Verrucomicrobiota bacterium]
MGLESTIVDVRSNQSAKLLRPGGINRETLEKVLGYKLDADTSNNDAESNVNQGLMAPGTLSSHYSPKTKLVLIPHGERIKDLVPTNPSAVVRCFRSSTQLEHTAGADTFWLAEDVDMAAVAHNMFNLLNTLDTVGYQTIFWELPPDIPGLSEAISDRLRRAAHKI